MSARRYPFAALALLGGGTVAQFGYHAVPAAVEADVWNASQAGVLLLLLALVANAYRSSLVWLACGLLAAWALLAAGCSVAYIVAPWVPLPGEAQCSRALDLPITPVAAWLAGLCMAHIWGRR